MKKILLSILTILLSFSLVACDNTNENEQKQKEIPVNEEEKVTYDYYEANLEVQTDPENPNMKGTYVYKLYLLSDNTYWLVSGVDCIEYETGTITKIENDYKLTETKTYGCDNCYYEPVGSIYNLITDGENAILSNEYIKIQLLKKENNEKLSDFMVNYNKKCGEE